MAKILLVEDDNNLREIYEARLQAEGYDIVAARDGEEALTIAMKERPDLIISDVMMPKISGFDMLDIIRSTEETKDAKVIMMTALSQAEDKERADKLGADRYLVKSQVTLEDVAKVAREVLSGESKASAPVSTPAPSAPQPATELPKPTPEPPSTPDPQTDTSQTDNSQSSTVDPALAAILNDTGPTATATPAPVTAQVDEPTASSDTPQPVTSEEPQEQTSATTPEPSVENTSAENTESTNSQQPDTSQEQEPPKVVASDSPALTAVAPATPTQTEETQDQAKSESLPRTDTGITQTVDDEKAAIAAQIESFIESKKTSEAPPAVDIKTKKKVISPINDLKTSAGPNLDNLLKKEVEKDKMASIAKQYASKEILPDDEYDAESTLKEAAENIGKHSESLPEATAQTPTIPVGHAPEVKISEDGDLLLPPKAPEVESSIGETVSNQTVEAESAPAEPVQIITSETASEVDSDDKTIDTTSENNTSENNDEVPQAENQDTPVSPETESNEEQHSEESVSEQTPESTEQPDNNSEPPHPLATAGPVIPHKNGTSIDGVVPTAQGDTEPKPEPVADIDLNDPNSISL